MGTKAGKRTAKSFDFRQPKTLERNQLKALELIFEGFTRPASSILGANLRLPCRIEVAEVEQSVWEDILTESGEVASVSTFNMAPLPPRAVLVIPGELALIMVDLRLGGSGSEPQESRNPTDIEQVIIANVVGEILGQIPNAFAPIAQVRIERLHSEPSLQFVQGIALNEMCIVVRFSISIGEREALPSSLVLPFALLRPLLDNLGSRPTVALERQSAGFAEALTERLRSTNIELKVVFSPTFLTSGEIVELRAGDIVRLGHRQGSPLDVMVDGVKLYKSQPTQVGNRVAVMLVEES